MERSPLRMFQQQTPERQAGELRAADPLKGRRTEVMNNFAKALEKLVDLKKKELGLE